MQVIWNALVSTDVIGLLLFCCAVAAFGLSFAVAKLLQMPRRHVGVFMAMCALNNTMFVGYAMCLALFGEASVPFVIFTYFIQSGCHHSVAATFCDKIFLRSPPPLDIPMQLNYI